MTVWGYSQNFLKSLEVAFGAHFLHDFYIKMFHI